MRILHTAIPKEVIINPTPSWTADPEGPYNTLPTESNETEVAVYTCPGVDDGAFVHQPMIHLEDGTLFIIWGEHRREEDCAGERIMWSYSTDNALTWSDPSVFLDSLSDVAYDGDSSSGWACRPTGWVTTDTATYAIIDVFEHKKSGEVGMLSIELDTVNKTTSTPKWIVPDVAPTAVSGYPQYSLVDSAVRLAILDKLYIPEHYPRWAAGSEDYWKTKRNSQIEPTGITLPAPYSQNILLWRDHGRGGDATTKWSEKKLRYTLDGANFYEQTNIPDDPSTGCLKILSDGKVGYMSNDERDVGLRERLFWTEADPCNMIFGTVYNVAEGSTVDTEYAGAAKAGGPQYVDFVEIGANYIVAAYSVFKQDIRVTFFRRPGTFDLPTNF